MQRRGLTNMKKSKVALKIFPLLAIPLLILFGCNSNRQSAETANKNSHKMFADYKNLNITILIDLSDRISSEINKNQAQKDKKIINYILESFKNHLNYKGVVHSEDKIKVIFYPAPENEVIQEIADSLNIDFSKYDFPERKKIFNNIQSLFNNQLNRLYSIAANAKRFNGSDLFNYFKYRVVDDCIIDNYSNLLVILSDGYIYDLNSKYSYSNRFSYLLPTSNHIKIFRKLNNWEVLFEKEDYGLIKLKNDLSALHILALEFSPAKHSPEDFDIMKKYWSKWFIEQKIDTNNFKILRTDINSLNRDLIQAFIKKIARQ